MFKYNLSALALMLALAAPLLVSCGPAASADPAPPAPTFPPPPPLDPAAVSTPEPAPPSAPAPQAAPQSASLLSATFDDGSLDGWTSTTFFERAYGVSWLPDNGSVLQAGDESGAPANEGAYLVAGEPDWQDYAVEADAFARVDTDLGLVARYSDSGFYRGSLHVGAEESELILTAVGADESFRELGRIQLGPTTNRWVHLRLEVRGQQLTLTVDNESSVSAQDGAFTAGRSGLYAEALGVARFDNVLITGR